MEKALVRILQEDSRYPADAYRFMSDALNYTVTKLAREKLPAGTRHVTGEELVIGIIEYAVSKYSVLAPEIFRHWNILQGNDAGNIVYNLIGAGIMSASPDDRREDFDVEGNIPESTEAILRKMERDYPDPAFAAID